MTLKVNGTDVPARVWEGRTESGVECHALITRIGVHREQDTSQFERELQETKPLSVHLEDMFPHGIPLRLVT